MPFYGILGVAALWHLALIAHEKEMRIFYIVYAVLFAPIFYIFSMFAIVLALRFPL